MADTGFSHPELARRWDLLVGRAWAKSWDLWIASSSRSYTTQMAWWEAYMAGNWPAPVADPNQIWGPSPFDWTAVGSLHMIQPDGFSHALDIGWAGASDGQMQALAAECGLRFPEPGEKWHAQWWGLDGVYPVKEEDMTVDEFMAQTGRLGDTLGCLEKRDGIWGQHLSDGNWYTVADIQEFIHRKLYPPPAPVDEAPAE
jgi:hypothetical protein